MKKDLRSIVLELRMPLSTTRASSMDSSDGGPVSNRCEARGSRSAEVESTPSSGLSANGVAMSNFMPAITWLLPMEAIAEPSAFCSGARLHAYLPVVVHAAVVGALACGKQCRERVALYFVYCFHTITS